MNGKIYKSIKKRCESQSGMLYRARGMQAEEEILESE